MNLNNCRERREKSSQSEGACRSFKLSKKTRHVHRCHVCHLLILFVVQERTTVRVYERRHRSVHQTIPKIGSKSLPAPRTWLAVVSTSSARLCAPSGTLYRLLSDLICKRAALSWRSSAHTTSTSRGMERHDRQADLKTWCELGNVHRYLERSE